MKLKADKILIFILTLYFFASTFFNNQKISIIAASLLLVATVLFSKNYKFKWNTFFTFELVFIIFTLFHSMFVSAIPKESLKMTITLTIKLFSELVLYNCFINSKNKEELIKKYLYPITVSLFVLIIIYIRFLRGSEYRLSFTNIDLSLMGLQFSGVGTTYGYIAGCASCVSWIIYAITKKKKYLICTLISLIIVILSGTRKVIIPCAIIFPLVPIMLSSNYKKVFNSIKYIIIIVLAVIAIFKVPVIYNTLGVRIERTINSYRNANVIDKSAVIRESLKSTAKVKFKEHPIFGKGISTFKTLYGNGLYSHSNVWELLYSCGIVGFILYYSMHLYVIKELIKNIKTIPMKKEKTMMKGFLILYLCMLLLDYWQVTYYVSRFSILSIIVISLIYLNNQNDKELN